MTNQIDPFVFYTFDTEQDARKALLELPFIQVAEDTKNLICTEVLDFGYYESESGLYEAIVCGDELTHDLWHKTKQSFIQHGGSPKGQGDLEPEKQIRPSQKEKTTEPGQVEFVKEDRQRKNFGMGEKRSCIEFIKGLTLHPQKNS